MRSESIRNLTSLWVRVGVCAIAVAAAGATLLAGKTYQEQKSKVTIANRSITLTCARPLAAPAAPFIVLLASGDHGLRFTTKTVYKHLAERNFFVVGFDSGDVLAAAKKSRAGLTAAELTDDMAALIGEGKRVVGLPESTLTVLAGVSSGASLVVILGGEGRLRSSLAGGVAISLTRESDYDDDPAEAKHGIPLDKRGRILVYPLIPKIQVPFAVIQSTKDAYVPSAESRELMGPDTATRRLYEVESRDHSFRGNTDLMLRDVDAAMAWIVESAGLRTQ